MSLCVACGCELAEGSFLCRHHWASSEDHWAEGNRIICDLLHRGILPPRLAREQRDEEVWAL